MHYRFYKDSRWNGRQIRNACQTALALAEYQAQQDNKSTELDSKIAVKLNVDNFETVRDAYLEFTKYLVDLYGANTAKVAEERYIRAKEKSDGGRDVIYTTKQLSQMWNDRSEPERIRPPALRRKPSHGVYSSGEADQRSWEERSGKPQNASSARDRNQTELSSTTRPHQTRRLLQPERVGQSRNSSRQQTTTLPLDMERESSSRRYNNSQRNKMKREPQPNWNPDDFGEDDNEYSDTQQWPQNQHQQEPDGISEEEQEDYDDDYSSKEQVTPASNRGRREQDDSRYARKRK